MGGLLLTPRYSIGSQQKSKSKIADSDFRYDCKLRQPLPSAPPGLPRTAVSSTLYFYRFRDI